MRQEHRTKTIGDPDQSPAPLAAARPVSNRR